MLVPNSPATQGLTSSLAGINCACIHVDVELVQRSGGDICVDLKWTSQMLLEYLTNDVSLKPPPNLTKICGFAMLTSK